MDLFKMLLFGTFMLTLFSNAYSWRWRSPYSQTKTPKCEPVQVPFCKGLHYSKTTFPNYFKHETQREAGLEVHQFSPLVSVKCSEDLKMFLCALYVPICTNFNKLILPCRSLCKRAKKGCVRLMNRYGFNWPEKMDCGNFPRKKRGTPCIDTKKKKKKSSKRNKKNRKGKRKQKKQKRSKSKQRTK